MYAFLCWICLDVICSTLVQPAKAIVNLNSSVKISNIFLTPSAPIAFKAHIAGLPTNTQSAPSAIALNTSEPLLIPPST